MQVPFQLGKSVSALKKLLIFLFIQFLCFLYFIGQATNGDIRNNNRTHQIASLSVVPLLGNIYICCYLFACVIFLSVLPFVVFHVQMEPYSLVLDTNPGQTLWWRLSKTTARFLSSQCVVVENFKDCSQNCWIEEAQNIFLPMSFSNCGPVFWVILWPLTASFHWASVSDGLHWELWDEIGLITVFYSYICWF